MTTNLAQWRRKSIFQRLQRLVQVHIWKMDIHPTTWIARTALIDRTWPQGIHIGQDCIIDEEVVILTHDLTRGLYLDTRIGTRTVIGPRAIILPGMSVGDDCIISAGALVNRDVPNNSIATGNPAQHTKR